MIKHIEVNNMGCVFCNVTSIVYEGVDWKVIEDKYKKDNEQIHRLIISKKHCTTISELEFNTSIQLMSLIDLLKQQHGETFYIRRNEGLYQHIPHVHWHFIKQYNENNQFKEK